MATSISISINKRFRLGRTAKIFLRRIEMSVIDLNGNEINMTPELSFLTEFDLGRMGMIKEIKTEFDIIRLCMIQLKELGKEYLPMIDRILVMPLRKLLCEKSSVLLRIAPNLKLSPLMGREIELDNKMKMISPNLTIAPQDKWIPVDQWLEQRIAWFDKNASDLPDMIPDFTYENIIDRFKKPDKVIFGSMFEMQEVMYQGSLTKIYTRIDASDETKNATIFSLLKSIGYYDLSLYNFLKHLSDKRGAHIDVGHSPVVTLVNSPKAEVITPVLCMAIQMIWVAKHQIPELVDYWPEMEIPEE